MEDTAPLGGNSAPVMEQVITSATPKPARPYRSKKRQPCDACRSRKIGCIIMGAGDACSLCQHRGIPCTFATKPRPKVTADKHRSSSSVGSKTISMPTSTTELKLRVCDPRQQSQALSHSFEWFDSTTMMTEYTCLYSGQSGDQHHHLLRQLNFNDKDLFGSSLWAVWRALPNMNNPVYFTIFPNKHLDQHPHMYDYGRLEQFVGQHEQDLIDLYYIYIHPSYPILETKLELEVRRRQNKVRFSLLACICRLAMSFWDKSEALRGKPRPEGYPLSAFIFSTLTIEASTPNLDVVSAMLLCLQFPTVIVREPNRPGYWALSGSLVAVAQDIGLHVDPSDWQIQMQERKRRRILWWAVYTHDKWLAHWLGRPSHITSSSWHVLPLTLDDFADNASMVNVNLVASARVFMALADLSTILANVLETFYTIRNNFSNIPFAEAVVSGNALRGRWTQWVHKASFSSERESCPGMTTLKIAGYTVELTILRAVFGSVSGSFDEQTASLIQKSLETILQILKDTQAQHQELFWLTYCAGNLQIIGALTITFLLASVYNKTLGERKQLLLELQATLVSLSEEGVNTFPMARSPLVRLNLVLEQIFEGSLRE